MTVTAEDERALVLYANGQPMLLSLLYDLDLMPEQVVTEEDRTAMLRVISVYATGAHVERKACAAELRKWANQSSARDAEAALLQAAIRLEQALP